MDLNQKSVEDDAKSPSFLGIIKYSGHSQEQPNNSVREMAQYEWSNLIIGLREANGSDGYVGKNCLVVSWEN